MNRRREQRREDEIEKDEEADPVQRGRWTDWPARPLLETMFIWKCGNSKKAVASNNNDDNNSSNNDRFMQLHLSSQTVYTPATTMTNVMALPNNRRI